MSKKSIIIVLLIGFFIAILVVVVMGALIFMQSNAREWKLQDDKTKASISAKAVSEQNILNDINQLRYNWCISSIDESYDSGWNSDCKSQGLPDNCSLPLDNAKRWDDYKTKEKDFCYKKNFN